MAIRARFSAFLAAVLAVVMFATSSAALAETPGTAKAKFSPAVSAMNFKDPLQFGEILSTPSQIRSIATSSGAITKT